MNTCADCRFSRQEADQLLCRRYPPNSAVIPMPGQDALGRKGISLQTVAAPTPVRPDEWCGEWAVKLTLTI